MPSSLARAWLPVVAWAALIFWLSSVPDLGTGLGSWDLLLRKLAHVGEYAVLGALLARALRRPVPAFALGVTYAVSDELHQHFVPGRRGAPLDVLIDAVGVALGVLVWRRLSRWVDFASWTRRRCPTGSSTPCSSGSTGSPPSSTA